MKLQLCLLIRKANKEKLLIMGKKALWESKWLSYVLNEGRIDLFYCMIVFSGSMFTLRANIYLFSRSIVKNGMHLHLLDCPVFRV